MVLLFVKSKDIKAVSDHQEVAKNSLIKDLPGPANNLDTIGIELP